MLRQVCSMCAVRHMIVVRLLPLSYAAPIICRTHAARVRHVIVVRDRKRVFLAERERERASLCGAACVRHIIVVWGGYD